MTNTPNHDLTDSLTEIKNSIIDQALEAHQTSKTPAHQIRVADYVSTLWEQDLTDLIDRIRVEAHQKAQEIAEKTRIAAPLHQALLDHLEPALIQAFASMAPLKSDQTPTTYKNSPSEVAARTAADLAEAISFNTATVLFETITADTDDNDLTRIANHFCQIAVPRIVNALTVDLNRIIDFVLNHVDTGETGPEAPGQDEQPEEPAAPDPWTIPPEDWLEDAEGHGAVTGEDQTDAGSSEDRQGDDRLGDEQQSEDHPGDNQLGEDHPTEGHLAPGPNQPSLLDA